jgi:hypothetical protein
VTRRFALAPAAAGALCARCLHGLDVSNGELFCLVVKYYSYFVLRALNSLVSSLFIFSCSTRIERQPFLDNKHSVLSMVVMFTVKSTWYDDLLYLLFAHACRS